MILVIPLPSSGDGRDAYAGRATSRTPASRGVGGLYSTAAIQSQRLVQFPRGMIHCLVLGKRGAHDRIEATFVGMQATTDQVGSSGFLAPPVPFAAKIILPPMNADERRYVERRTGPCLTG